MNEQKVVGDKRVVVQLLQTQASVAISVHDSYPVKVSIEPLLKGGLDERGALIYVMEIAAAGASGALA